MFRPFPMPMPLLSMLLAAGCSGPTTVALGDGAANASIPRDAGRPELPPVDASAAGTAPDTGPALDAGPRPDAAAAATPAATAAQACADHAAALCGKWNACAPFYLRLWFNDVPGCTGRMRQLCELQLAAPGTVETPVLRQSCAKELSARSCAAWLALDVPSACQPTPGPLVDGRGCSSSWQCQSTYCATESGCGVCAPRSKRGGSCTEDAGCRDGLVCSSSGRCAEPAALGESCGEDAPCQPGGYCNLGICATLRPAGTSCTEYSCNNLEGLYCSDTGSVCRAGRLAGLGEACGWIDATTWSSCTGATYCLLPSSTAVEGTCAAAAGDGQVCSDQSGPLCAPPATCRDGRCRLPSSCDM